MANKIYTIEYEGEDYDIDIPMFEQRINWNGLIIHFNKQGRMVRLLIAGTLTADIATSKTYIKEPIPYPSGFESSMNNVTFSILTGGKFGRVYTHKNGIYIGYTKNMSDNSDCVLSTGDLIYWTGVYITA